MDINYYACMQSFVTTCIPAQLCNTHIHSTDHPTVPTHSFSVPGQATAAPSSSMGTAVHIPPRQHPLSPGLTSIASFSSLVSNTTAMSRCSYKGPSIVKIRG